MKNIFIISFLFLCVTSFSQQSLSTEEDSIYIELKNRRQSDSLKLINKLSYLKTELFKDIHNDSLIYQIGSIYYKDFIYPYEDYTNQFSWDFNFINSVHDSISNIIFERDFKNSFLQNSADSSLFYFKQIDSIDSDTKKMLFFAIKHLECFVNSDSSYFDLSSLVKPNDYIPYWYLANLNENWQCDKSKNYLSLIFTSLLITPDNRSSLSKMDERSLYQMELNKNSEIFRLTYCPSFNDDICIRVERNESKVILYWKISKKQYGFTIGLKKEGKEEISFETWQYFLQLLDDFNFKDLPNSSENLFFFDGASWFLEYKTNSNYKAHYTRIPNKEIEILCLYLLELSRIKYKTNKWEADYFTYDLILTEDKKYVLTKDLEDTIIYCLNQYIDKNIEDNECCCYFDSYLKFNKSGKIRFVRFPDDENWFIDKWWAYLDRDCRKEMKKALIELNLSYLRLQKPIYYYLQVNYDKEKHKFIEVKNNSR